METITTKNNIYRESIANAIASLAGTETVIDDLSISKVIDAILPVVTKAAGHGYDVGRVHQVNGGTKTEFMDKYFPESEATV